LLYNKYERRKAGWNAHCVPEDTPHVTVATENLETYELLILIKFIIMLLVPLEFLKTR
jgi:hypothetical protein